MKRVVFKRLLTVPCVIILLSFSVGLFPRTAFAAPPQIVTITDVWTRDGNGNDKPSFAPGNAIQYTVLITNSSSQPVTISIQFWAIGPLENAKTIYRYKHDNLQIPAGLSGWYSPSTIPNGTPGGEYAVVISITNGPGGESDEATNVFTVTPVGGLSIPSTGTVTNLFLDTSSSEEWYSNYYDQNNVLSTRPPRGAHSGLDISNNTVDCQTSSPVRAAAGGEVIWAGWGGAGFGWSVVIKHGYGLMNNGHYTYTLYAHMGTVGTDSQTSTECLEVGVGYLVYTRVILGYQGSSGLSARATHVHFMIFAGDQDAPELSSPYDLINKYGAYPASPDWYTCMQLTLGDPSPLGSVTQGSNNC